MSDAVSISLSHLLWRTAGRSWEYRFVMCPRFVEDPYSLQVELFGDVVVGDQENIGSGLCVTTGGAMPYVATAFRDPKHRDTASRPILHYMTWFPPAEVISGRGLELPDNWGVQVLAQLQKDWDVAFGSESPSILEGHGEASRLLVIDAANGRQIDFDRRIDLKKNGALTPNGGSSRQGRQTLWALMMALAVAAAFVCLRIMLLGRVAVP